MKKIYSFLFAATALFAASSCQKEVAPEVEAPEFEKITFTASTEVDTKTALHENGKSTIWVAGDQISVFDANKEANNRCFNIDKLTEDAKTATFSYEGEFVKDNTQADPTVVALYPYQANAYCDFFYYDRNYITGLNFPAEQTAVAGGFDPKAGFALGLGTMGTMEIGFQNLYALLKFTVRDAAVKKVTVKVNEGAYIAGDAKIQMTLNTNLINNKEGKPVFESPVLSIVENGTNEITLTCDSDKGFDTEATYYVAVVPTTFTSISLYCDDVLVNHKDATMTLEANKIYNLKDNGSAKKERNLAFDAAQYTATLGKSFTAPQVSGVTEGVEYTSSDDAIAAVDPTSGAVTLKKAGTVTITAAAAESRYYLAGKASYTLTVKEPIKYGVYVCISDLGWTSVNMHIFNSDGYNTEWPGVALTEYVTINGKTYYKKTIEEGTELGITYNNGKDNSNYKIDLGETITVNEDIYYRLSARGAIKVDPDDKTTFGYAIYVFDQKSKNQAPNLYTWNDNGKWEEEYGKSFYPWPGATFVEDCYYKPADDQQHRHYYYYVIPTNLYDVQFNYIVNKKGQTSNLTAPKNLNGDLYVGYWYNDANNNGFWVNNSQGTPITNLN